MAIVVGTVAVVIALMVAFGPERHGVAMSAAQQRAQVLGNAVPAAGS
jgi:hypothetical protein